MTTASRVWLSITKQLPSSLARRTKTLIEFAVVATVLIYLAIGAFPVVPLENDGMRMSLGVQTIDLYGDYSHTYNYAMQAGIYTIVGFLSETLGLQSFQAFSILTFSLSIVFILVGSLFISRLLHTRFITCFAVLVAFQEVYVSGYYPNSSMVAAAFLSAAFLAAAYGRQLRFVVLSAISFSVAVWCRIDAVLMGAVFLSLLYEPNRRSFLRILLFGFVFLGGLITLYAISHVSLQLLLEEFSQEVGLPPSIGRTATIYSTIFSLAVVYFSLLGLIRLYELKNWRLMFLSLIAPLPLLLAYGIHLDSPKKILYAMPLFAISAAIGLQATLERKNKVGNYLLIIGLVLVTGQYIFTPAFEIMFSRSTIVPTSDEPRLRGAIAYTPIYYAGYRQATLGKDVVFQHNLSAYLEQNNPSYIVSQDWMANQWLPYFLQGSNFRIKETEKFAQFLENGERLVLTRGSETVYLVRWLPEASLDLPVSLQEEIRSMPSVLYIGPDYTTTDYAQKSFLSDRFNWQRLTDWGRFETILFQK